MQVRRREFVDTLSQRGGQIDVRRMSPNLRAALRARGVSGEDLRTIAGRDHVIRGAEFSRLYDRVFRSQTPAANQAHGDLTRANDLFGMLRTEAARNRMSGAAANVGIGARRGPRTGIDRPGHNHNSGASGGDLDVRYTPAQTPDVDPNTEAPSEPNLFEAILEFLFGWLGMETDTDRLQEYGQQLGDQYGAEIDAFRTAYANEHGSSTMSNGMPVPRSALNREIRSELVDNVAARMRAQGVSSGDAEERAGVVVDAMLARVDANNTRDEQTAAAQGLPSANTRTGRTLASVAASTRRSAERLRAGGDDAWVRRTNEALAPIADSHPWVAANPPADQDRARAGAMTDRLRAVQYLMALDQAGGLDDLGANKDEIVDGLLSAQANYDAGSRSVGAAASALTRLDANQRADILTATRGVPEDRRAIVFGVVAREHGSLASSDPAERAGAVARVQAAATQASSMSVDHARAALDRGTIGLEEAALTIDYGRGRRIEVPMYFHPAVSAEDRAAATDLVREAYGHLPYRAMERIVAAEGDQQFNVQILPNGSFNAGGSADPARPTSGDGAHAFYQTDDNQIRVNMSMFSHDLEVDPGAREKLVTMILHETTHELDDLGNTDQDLGFFVHHHQDRARDRARTSGDGDLAPTWAHVSRSRARFDRASTNVGESRRARRYFTLSRQSTRTSAEQVELLQLGREIAQRSGTTTPYSATGGNGQKSLQMAEWWAETYSRYANPATRARLRAVDPVAHRAAARYHQLLANGAPPPDAIRTALRFSLATDVSANQGTSMLDDQANDTPLTDTQLDDLDAIGRAYTDHAAALDGWAPYRNDTDLRSIRGREAGQSVEAGRSLLTAIGERKAVLEASGRQNSREYQRLTSAETTLRGSIDRLESYAEPSE